MLSENNIWPLQITRHEMLTAMVLNKRTCWVMIYIIGIGLCGQWQFLLAGQITQHSVGRPRTGCGAKSFYASLYRSSSCDVVDLEKSHFKVVYKTTFTHVYLSSDQAAPRVWNLNSSVSSVEPMVSYHVWLLICLYQYQYQSPKRRTTAKPCIPIFLSFACITCRTRHNVMQKHAWILCSVSLWTALIICIQFSLGLHEYQVFI